MKKKYFFFIVLILIFAANSFAAVIDAVEVEGNRRIPTSTILKYAVEPGEEFSLADVDSSIKKNLFSADIITDVKVDMRLSDDRLVLVYIVTEKPYVNKVFFLTVMSRSRQDIWKKRLYRWQGILSTAKRSRRTSRSSKINTTMKSFTPRKLPQI